MNIEQMQLALDGLVKLLGEIKALDGIPDLVRREVDDAIDEIQAINRKLPSLAKGQDSISVVFNILEKVRRIWQRIARGGW